MDTYNITLNKNDNPSSSSSSPDTSKKSSCKYTGVRLRKWGKWVSEIRLPNSRERIWLGSYDTAEKAARAFDAAQFCLRGKSANFNFPNDPPDIPGGQSMSRSEIQAAAARFANLAATATQEPELVESMVTTYSPTISEGTVQMDSEMTRAEMSFHEQLSLSATLGSGNYVSEYGYFTGFDDYLTGEYHTVSQPDNYCGYNEEDIYDTSLYHDTCLWNF
ncbi:ethylene-responsive transcription factor ERF017-like [Silene latifolia]|uniref:ethylene-responsive transcription factor ERF017-like n=1 Tax=Silene latifolia TaxID=37657 RepID=UPI003D777B70